jgi:prepilin-type N-terminal cleavage/methylation domain-containing protein
MRLSHKHCEPIRARAAFTLIELLVVIAIIAILVALTSAAVMRVLVQGPRVQARSDLSQLDTALAAFKAKFGQYPPSRIKLCSNISMYGSTQLDLDSIAFLKQVMFPQLGTTWASGGVNWQGNVGTDGTILTGDQCLVFFLGGIPVNNGGAFGTLGFATGNNPTAFTSGGSVIGRFFEFPSNKLVQGPNGWLQFKDPWGIPYAYFSSYSWKNPNQYNRPQNMSYAAPGGLSGTGGSDCPTLPGTPSPYFLTLNPAAQFYNPNTGQIISAGPNQVFGPGGQWASQTAAPGGPGADDLCNFYSNALGVAGQ